MRHVVRIVAYAFALGCFATPLAAQAGTIRGTVRDSTGSPLANASLTVEGTTVKATSGSQGDYELRGVPTGQHTVRARLIGFVSATAPVTVVAGQTARQDFTLARSPVQLAPIDVVLGSRARHTASEELAVPVDVFPAEELQAAGHHRDEPGDRLSPRPFDQLPPPEVTDAGDIVRPFTLRGLCPTTRWCW